MPPQDLRLGRAGPRRPGIAVGPVLFGLLIPCGGDAPMYLALGGIALVAAALSWRVHGRRASTGGAPAV